MNDFEFENESLEDFDSQSMVDIEEIVDELMSEQNKVETDLPTAKV